MNQSVCQCFQIFLSDENTEIIVCAFLLVELKPTVHICHSAGLGAHYFRISTISCNEKKITENNTSFLSRQPQSIPGYQSNQASLSCLLFIGYLDLKIRRLNKTTATKTVNVNKIQKSHHSRLKFDKKGQKHTVFSHAAKFSS